MLIERRVMKYVVGINSRLIQPACVNVIRFGVQLLSQGGQDRRGLDGHLHSVDVHQAEEHFEERRAQPRGLRGHGQYHAILVTCHTFKSTSSTK